MKLQLKPHERIIAALDVDTPEKAFRLAKLLKGHVGAFKLGTELATNILASVVTDTRVSNIAYIRNLFEVLGKDIFGDGKLHDIPETVRRTILGMSKVDVKMLNLHASAGREAIRRAVASKGDALLLAVTVLTSLDEDDCLEIYGGSIADTTMKLAKMASEEGADGLICAPGDLANLNKDPDIEKMIKVCPNTRSSWAQKENDDQSEKRQMTPGAAVTAGATYIVSGSQIYAPPEGMTPVESADRIALEIDKAINLPRGGE